MRAALDPLAAAGKLGALLAQFPASFKADAAARDYLALAAARVPRLPRRRGAAAPELERRPRRRRSTLLNASQRRVGADRRAEVQDLDPAELPAERRRASTTCGCTAATPSSGGRTRRPPTATTISTRATSSTPFVEVAEAARTLVKKMYLYTNNHFDGEGGGQRRDVARSGSGCRSRAAIRRRSSSAIPRPAAWCRRSAPRRSPRQARTRSLF